LITVLSIRFWAAISALVAAGRGLIFGLGVTGLGGVLTMRLKTSWQMVPKTVTPANIRWPGQRRNRVWRKDKGQKD
jgi:hypothetical protein